MNFKQLIQDYFTFSRNERKGITILLVIVFFLAIANKVIFYFETPDKINTYFLDNVQIEMVLLKDSVSNHVKKENRLFHFNPNTIDHGALNSLNLPDAIKRNLLKFREKGGKFNSVADFRKIYGVTDSIYNIFSPFLVFENRTVQLNPQNSVLELFQFNPNTATDMDFMRLGLTEKQIQTIRKYQSKGGSFKKKNDFLKIYGISEFQKEALSDYITIEKEEIILNEKEAEVVEFQIEINSADSIDLMKLPGIGDKLSKRIVKYRDLLGGFNSIAQLKEVYGLSDQVIQKIEGKVTIDPARIRKVDLNFADWNELAKHPYIKKNLAIQIIKFRTKYGSIQDPEVLRDSMILNIVEFARLKPYL